MGSSGREYLGLARKELLLHVSVRVSRERGGIAADSRHVNGPKVRSLLKCLTSPAPPTHAPRPHSLLKKSFSLPLKSFRRCRRASDGAWATNEGKEKLSPPLVKLLKLWPQITLYGTVYLTKGCDSLFTLQFLSFQVDHDGAMVRSEDMLSYVAVRDFVVKSGGNNEVIHAPSNVLGARIALVGPKSVTVLFVRVTLPVRVDEEVGLQEVVEAISFLLREASSLFLEGGKGAEKGQLKKVQICSSCRENSPLEALKSEGRGYCWCVRWWWGLRGRGRPWRR